VQSDHYNTVGEASVWALGQSLQQDFTSEVREAWVVTYAHLADIMRKAADSSPATAAV